MFELSAREDNQVAGGNNRDRQHHQEHRVLGVQQAASQVVVPVVQEDQPPAGQVGASECAHFFMADSRELVPESHLVVEESEAEQDDSGVGLYYVSGRVNCTESKDAKVNWVEQDL